MTVAVWYSYCNVCPLSTETEPKCMTLQAEMYRKHPKYARKTVTHHTIRYSNEKFLKSILPDRWWPLWNSIFHFHDFVESESTNNCVHVVSPSACSITLPQSVSYLSVVLQKYASQFHTVNNGLKLEVVRSESVIHWYFSFILHFISFHLISLLQTYHFHFDCGSANVCGFSFVWFLSSGNETEKYIVCWCYT